MITDEMVERVALAIEVKSGYVIADGKPIAMLAPTDNAAAVVASIVRTVNSHADLVAALEITKTMLADQPIGNAIVDVATMQTLNSVIAVALAKAKEEQS